MRLGFANLGLLLCLSWAAGCSGDRTEDDPRGGGGSGADAGLGSGGGGARPGSTDFGMDHDNPMGPNRPPPPGAPSGCVNPGELNEFGLPICETPATMDAAVPQQPGCAQGFDELGRPVCLGDSGIPETPPPPSCVRGGLCEQLVFAGGGQLDLLFMIDNSGSMREEQAALVREMPRLIDVLTSGDADADGVQDFPAVADLHVGVISSNMGIGGEESIAYCQGAGDDGMLRNTPPLTATGCAGTYPTFLSYDASTVDPNQAASDFACIGTLGTEGCGYEQQLESVLKAVTPSSSDRRFLATPYSAPAVVGNADGYNAGFQRPDSLFAIVLVTDEEDCSAREPRLFTPTQYLDPSDPLYAQPLNLRCYYNSPSLFDVSRYITGLQEIRPPGSQLVLFAAIVGVPPELVDETARAGVDFSDRAQSDAYYDAILASPGMQETIDPLGPDTLTPSCDTANGRAYPPRRILQVAKAFGEQAVVQSICQDSFAPALQPIVQRISESLTVGCLPQTFERDGDGRVACDVIWELPAPGTPGASLGLCEERSYLAVPEARELRTSVDGRTRCILNQLAVSEGDGGLVPEADGSGWYYDDFTSEATERCGGGSDQRVVFTDDVLTPADVRVYVDCAAP
jgi:hypothetical protein